ncbi:MAG: carboxypeptidase regulatory-like domain-containing protein, partial [Bacteroidales bacterium]|nr:carboxypeptidase regulatory-like domain-containing protein [Bacteroidales bacterium]
ASVTGQIYDAHGEPLPGCEVSARAWPCDLITETTTDGQGTYTLHGIPSATALRDFYQRKNGRAEASRGNVKIHARLDKDQPLHNTVNYQIKPQEGTTHTGLDLTVGQALTTEGKSIGKVTGKVTGNTLYSHSGLKIRLDNNWGQMVETDLQGRFAFPHVATGSHRLTAYLPHNLRYDRGIGQTNIEVSTDQALENITIPLENLAQCRVQYLDMNGNPLAGITAGATWSKTGHGGWTEGTVSDAQGWAVLYLYPGQTQHIRGYFKEGSLVTEMPVAIKPNTGQILDTIQIVMVPAATLTGTLLSGTNPLRQTAIECLLSYTNGYETRQQTVTNDEGEFQIQHVSPGIFSLTVKTEQQTYQDLLPQKQEAAPGQAVNLGPLTLQATKRSS